MNFEGAPNIDPSMAKQIASLSAVGIARVANVPPGPSAAHPQPPQSGSGANSGSYLGAMPINGHATSHDNTSMNPFGVSPAFPNFQAPNTGLMTQQQQPSLHGNLSLGESNMAGSNRQQPPAATLKQRQRNFLNGLTSVMSARGTPLPPALTGVPNPQYDPNTSLWKALEPSPTEVGAFRLAGKDVDLFRLWGLVFQAGGHAKVCLVRLHLSYHSLLTSIISAHSTKCMESTSGSIRPPRTYTCPTVQWTAVHATCCPCFTTLLPSDFGQF